MSEVLMTSAQVAEYLQMSLRTVEDWRLKSKGPKFIRLSQHRIRYRRSDVDAWLDNLQASSKEA